MRVTKIKRWMLVFCWVLLAYPFVEMLAPMQPAMVLHRFDRVSKVEVFSTQSWFDGTFQESAQDFINDNIGLFPLFIHIHHQIEYSLFDNIYTGSVVKGKEKYLFTQGYLDAYVGQDFVGYKKIENSTLQLKALQDTLQHMGKFLMVCLSANKTTYFPEYMPDSTRKDSTNFESYVKLFDANGINYLNCNKWFLEMKDTSGYLLFPPYGIHWSHYGSVMVADSIAKYISKKASWPLADLRITARNYSKKTRYFDNDIASAMNLFNVLEPDSMLYPEFEWLKPSEPQQKKKLLIIGDSFTWDIFENVGLGTDCFDDIEFWFYNQTVHTVATAGASLDWSLPVLTRHMNLSQTLNDFDAFLILTNEPNLEKFAWGFVNDALNTLSDSNFVREERMNDYLAEQCRNLPGWRQTLEEMAEARGVSLDSMIHIYLHDRNFKPL